MLSLGLAELVACVVIGACAPCMPEPRRLRVVTPAVLLVRRSVPPAVSASPAPSKVRRLSVPVAAQLCCDVPAASSASGATNARGAQRIDSNRHERQALEPKWLEPAAILLAVAEREAPVCRFDELLATHEASIPVEVLRRGMGRLRLLHGARPLGENAGRRCRGRS